MTLEEITQENAELRTENAALLQSLEAQAKTFGALSERLARAIEYCQRHTYSGVNLAAHVYLAKVLEILKPPEME